MQFTRPIICKKNKVQDMPLASRPRSHAYSQRPFFYLCLNVFEYIPKGLDVVKKTRMNDCQSFCRFGYVLQQVGQNPASVQTSRAFSTTQSTALQVHEPMKMANKKAQAAQRECS